MAAAGTAIMDGAVGDGAVGDGVAGGAQVSTSAHVTMVMGITLTLDTLTTAATDTIIGGIIATGGGTITTIATSRALAEGRLAQGCAPRVRRYSCQHIKRYRDALGSKE
jgi:hypothetical protein